MTTILSVTPRRGIAFLAALIFALFSITTMTSSPAYAQQKPASILELVSLLGLDGTSGLTSEGLQKKIEKYIDSGDTRRDAERAQGLASYKFTEPANALITRLMREIIKAKKSAVPELDVDVDLVVVLLQTIQKVASHSSYSAMQTVKATADEHISNLRVYDREIKPLFLQTIKIIKENKWSPRSLLRIYGRQSDEITAAVQIDEAQRERRKTLSLPADAAEKNSKLPKPETYKQRLEHFQQGLDAKIIGQPEVVDALVKIRSRDLFYGFREKPAVLVLLGQPGTGKDTSAEAFVDTIFGYEGAHEKHMFRFPVTKNAMDASEALGSGTGYIGSDNVPPLIRMLVEHSAGRYEIVPVEESDAPSPTKRKKEYKVIENPEWQQGEVLEGYYPPSDFVVFVNEFHDWSKASKNSVLKQALEKGYFPIKNPNGGLAEIYVPVTFVVASNDGIELVTSRESDGTRFRKPLSYDQQLAKWEAVHKDKDLLKNTLSAQNRKAHGRSDEAAPGISEEVLNRLPNSQILLMRPLSPQDILQITKLKFARLTSRLANAKGHLGGINITFGPEIPQFIQQYDYQAEEAARPVDDKIETLIEKTLFEALRNGDLPEKAGLVMNVQLSLKQLDDHTYHLVFHVLAKNVNKTFERPILYTEKDRKKEPLSDDKIDELLTYSARMKERVFGLDDVLDRVGSSLAAAAESHHSGEPRKAQIYFFLGPSSVGKSETTKALSELVMGKDEPQLTINFRHVQTLDDLKEKILGSRDSHGQPKESEFIKDYRRNQGRMLVTFEEALSPGGVRSRENMREILQGLLDIFDEPVVTTFSDGIPRDMSGVTIVMTGNLGQEWYENIPKNLPPIIQQNAMREIYDAQMQNPGERRDLLEAYLSPALLNRVGQKNIFFFPTLSHKAIRQQVHLKLAQALKRLKPQESRRGWYIRFDDKQEYVKLVEMIENDGFNVQEQGRSIDRFIKEDIELKLRKVLLEEKIPSGSYIDLSVEDSGQPEFKTVGDRQIPLIKLKLNVENRQTLYVSIEADERPTYPQGNAESKILTAYHEAGHAIVMKTYFKDFTAPSFISIVPGVTQIEKKWIVYNGIAVSTPTKNYKLTREAVLRDMAVLYGGTIGQELVSVGARTDAGKNNDMQRASQLARKAILQWGLSPKWGTETAPQGTDLIAYVNHLPPARKTLFFSEFKKLTEEARQMAKTALLVNYQSALIPLATSLAEKGRINQADLKKLMAGVMTEDSPAFTSPLKRWSLSSLKAQLSQLLPRRLSVTTNLRKSVPRPQMVADVVALEQQRKAAEVDSIDVPTDIPIKGSCQKLLTKPAGR